MPGAITRFALAIMATMYTPFSKVCTAETWFPFPHEVNSTYKDALAQLNRYVGNDDQGKRTGKSYLGAINFISSRSPHRLGTALPPSGAWNASMAHLPPAWKLGTPCGLIYDDIYLELVQATPCPHFYARLLAARDKTLLSLARKTQGSHSKWYTYNQYTLQCSWHPRS